MRAMPQHHPAPPAPILLWAQFLIGIVPIAQIVGAMYQGHSPGQLYIPIYVWAMVAVSLLLAVVSVMTCFARFRNHVTWKCLVSLLFFCWYIVGNVWMASIRNPDYKALSSMDTYWNNTLDLFASLTTKLFCILLVCILFCLMIFS
ncbi:hypothetical protein KUDE01_015043 [Dissostichus eleginoides]|uniref:Uncharacterized protein n=1 Tax=Dissostichus eleginoides TaxID=100907 RepID=A0AAD9BWK0_DISEL|nr:hypothetical protein KUDE01_015043 [Dissostichus eleginoides]